jgi:outer membrane protein TolC
MTVCRIAATCVAIATAATAGIPVARADAPMTLAHAIELALTRNERAAIADLETSIADAGVSEARTRFLPLITLDAGAAYRPRNDPSLGADARLALTQPLLDPGAFPLLSQAKHTLAAQQATTADERRRLAFDTANAYIAVLLAEQVVQAAERKHETAVANRDTTDAQVKAQLVSSNDVTRAQISLANASRELAASKGNLDAAYVELELVVNAKLPRSLALPTELLESGRRELVATDTVLADSVARRADLLANRELARAAHDFAREPRARYLPSLDLGAQVTAQAPADVRSIDALIGLNLTWTLFDSGTRSAQIRAREGRAKIADLQASLLVREIEAEVRTAAHLLASRQEALDAAAAARDAARKGADEAAILYRQGLAKAIELVDANDQRFTADVNYATAEFDVASAYLSLRLAMGLQPLDGSR